MVVDVGLGVQHEALLTKLQLMQESFQKPFLFRVSGFMRSEESGRTVP